MCNVLCNVTCDLSEAARLEVPGDQHLVVMTEQQADLEYDTITIRFKTLEPNGLLLALRDDQSKERKRDSLEVALSRGQVLVTICMSGHDSQVRAGAGLDGNVWHTLQLIRSEPTAGSELTFI